MSEDEMIPLYEFLSSVKHYKHLSKARCLELEYLLDSLSITIMNLKDAKKG